MKINSKNFNLKLKDYLQSDNFRTAMSEINGPPRRKSKASGWTIKEIESEILKFKRMIFTASKRLTKENNRYTSSSGSDMQTLPAKGLRWSNVTPDTLIKHKIINIKRDAKDKNIITSCRVELSFNQNVIKSPSLFDHNNGTDNLLRLLTNGWDFRGGSHKRTLRGIWYVGSTRKGNPTDSNAVHGVYAKRYRQPNPILFDAVDRYNHKSDNNIFASLNNTYISVQDIGNIRFGL